MRKKKVKLKKNVRLKSLEPAHQTRTRKEFIDYDYTQSLNEESKRFLAQFTDEYYGGAISKTNGRVDKGHLHSTNELAKDCYDRNNRQNNDVLGVTKINGLASDVVSELDKNDGWYVTNRELTENASISRIEEKDSDDVLLTYKEYLKVKDQLTPEMLLFYLNLYEND